MERWSGTGLAKLIFSISLSPWFFGKDPETGACVRELLPLHRMDLLLQRDQSCKTIMALQVPFIVSRVERFRTWAFSVANLPSNAWCPKLLRGERRSWSRSYMRATATHYSQREGEQTCRQSGQFIQPVTVGCFLLTCTLDPPTTIISGPMFT